MTKKTKAMPENYDVEVFQGETFVQGFSGPNALCDAIGFMNNQQAPYIFYDAYDLNSGLAFGGPRPANPPAK